MRKILITGATGFIGGALSKALTADDVHLVLQSRKAKGAADRNTTLVPFGIELETDWTEALEGVDTVIHCAALAHERDAQSKKNISQIREMNIGGTINLAKQAKKLGVSRFIFLSSVAVYGESPNLAPFTENSVCNPQSEYGRSKLEAERSLMNVVEDSDMSLAIVRMPAVYGPGMKGALVRFMNIVYALPILPFAAMNEERSFLYVGNLMNFLKALIDSNSDKQIFLVCDKPAVSVSQLVSVISNELGTRRLNIYIPKRLLQTAAMLFGKKHEVDRLMYAVTIDMSQTSDELKWKPPIKTTDGWAATISWYKKLPWSHRAV